MKSKVVLKTIKTLSFHKPILSLILPVLFIFTGMTSCVNDKFEEEPGLGNIQGKGSMQINIAAVSRYASIDEVPEIERIRSLRIVVTNNYDEVEKNLYFPDVSERDFYTGKKDFIIIDDLTPGNKNVYLFANEEGVNNIDWGNPWYGIDTLHDLLEGANKERDAFGTHMNKVNFSLNQGEINRFGIPYSAVYSQITVTEKESNEYNFYLVPVVAKIRLNIYNYRNEDVTLNSASISSIADRTFLMAHVGNEDLNKTLPNQSEPLYWIDWLHEVSELSWNYDTPVWNDWFNNQYGWITDYSLPDNVNFNNIYFKESQISNNAIITKEPDYTVIEYLTESKNSNNSQKYKIEFIIPVKEMVWNPWFPSLPNLGGSWEETIIEKTFSETIEGLNYLFRNTFLDIDVELSENGYISVEYTVCPWSNKSTTITFD